MTAAGLLAALLAADPGPATTMNLYPVRPPEAKGDGPADTPTLTVTLPAKDAACGTAVVVCPGGGYGGHAMDHEGKQIAEWLAARGVAAFVLKYRLTPYRHPVPLLDAQRAIRTVRARASEYGIDPAKVGIWGFSAGGHLASTAATHFDAGKPDDADPVERVSCRPDFAVLAYPVITLVPPFAHTGSRNNLLGKDADPKLVASLCNESAVTRETPPCFLFHTGQDTAVPPENSLMFFLALRKAGVPAELHVYESGGHGVGLAAKLPALAGWPDRLSDWMRGRGLLPKGP